MSLKAFHIFFIAVSILLALAVGVWGVYVHLQETNLSLLVLGVGSLAVGAGLIVYGVKTLPGLPNLKVPLGEENHPPENPL